MIKLVFCPFSEPVLPLLKGLNNFLYIAPSGRKSAEIKTRLLTSSKTSVFYSLDRFVAQLLKKSKKYADDKFKLVLVQGLLASSREYGALFNSSPGSVSVLVELLNDLKNYGYAGDIENLKAEVAAELSGYEKVSRRALFAVSIFEKYQQVLFDLDYADDIDRLADAAELLKSAKFPQKTLVLDGFFDLPAGQQVFFEALLKLFPDITVIHYGDERLDELSGIKSEFLEYLQKDRECAVEKVRPSRPARFPALIPVNKAPSVEEEVSIIARHIRELTDNKKTEYKDILLTFPSMWSYVPYIKRIFPAYGIPFTVSLDVSLGSLPQVFPAKLLLKTVISGFARRSVVDIFSSSAFNVFSGEARKLVSPVSRLGGLTGGLLQWEEILERLKNEEPAYFEKLKIELKIFSKDLKKFIKAVLPLEKKATLLGFVRTFRKSLKELGFSVSDKAGKDAFNDLFFSMEKMLLALKGGKNNSRENARLFLAILEKAPFWEEQKAKDGVKVLGVLDTRGLGCRHLFFGGLSDGDFPVKPKQEMIFPDKLRRKLGLIDFERRIELQKHHFFRLLQAPAEGLYLSYPAQKDDRLVFPSNFIPESSPKKDAPFPGAPQFLTEEAKQREEGTREGRKQTPGFIRAEFADKKKVEKFLRSLFSVNTEISVTSLDRYLDCPRIFYLEKILGFSLLKEPGFEVESAKLGTIMHDIMEGLFLPGTKTLAGLPSRLAFSSKNALHKSAVHPFWQEHVTLRLNTLLKRLVKQEELLAAEYPSVYCLEKKGSIKLPGIKAGIKGRLDRVDTNERGFVVIDYKTGSGVVRYFEKTKKGESVQLPLYARMVSAEQPGLMVSGLCIYDLKEGRARLVKKEAVAGLYEQALVTATSAVRAILNGDFPGKEKKSDCYNCRYVSICGR